MRKSFVLLLACAICNTAGTCNMMPEDSVIRAEMSKEELEAAPGYHQMKAAILYDVRVQRELESKVILPEAQRELPRAITWVKGLPICSVDQTEYEIYRLKEGLLDQSYRIDETAYLCRKEGVYYYHYQGGPRRLDVWIGPNRIERKRPKTDDQ
jgi:hypothetical protein